MKRIGNGFAAAWWRLGLIAGLLVWAPALRAQQPEQPGPPRPRPSTEGLERLIGEAGTVRSTGRLALDFGLWVATLLGCGLVAYGVYHAIKQSGEMEQQRSYGKSIMYTLGGAALSGIKFIWTWIATSITGQGPTEDLGLGF